MPSCCVINCLHNSYGPFRLFRFPTDEERRKKWAVNCGRINWFPNDYTRICEVHFDESQFEQKRQDGKKLLKWNAVPTLFNNSNRLKRAIKRNFWRNKDSEDETSPEPTNNEELKIDTVSGTPEALDEVCKTIGRPRSCNTQGPLTNHEQLQKLDEIALIKAVLEKMGHEVQSENCHIELNQDGKKIAKDSISPPVVKKVKSPVRTPVVKRYPPKRIKLQEKTLCGSNCHVTEEVPRAQEKAWKPAEETGVPQVEPEDLEDELAQIKAEIKKLMYEANVDEPSGSHVLKSTVIPTACSVSSLPPRVASFKKHVQNGMTKEETTSSRSFIILSPLSTEVNVNGSCCKDQELVGNYTVISEKNRCLPVEVGIQTDKFMELEVVPQLKAEVELLKHQLAEKDKKIRQLEQRLAAILQPGQILLLQKFGCTLSGAKKYVILGKQPNKTAAEKVS